MGLKCGIALTAQLRVVRKPLLFILSNKHLTNSWSGVSILVTLFVKKFEKTHLSSLKFCL